ncbi:hypothetical protein OCF10_21550 [Bacillus cereus]|nr:hypothetical protein [Bacillus cereus]
MTFLAGDRISLKVTTGGVNATTDTVAQVEIFNIQGHVERTLLLQNCIFLILNRRRKA